MDPSCAATADLYQGGVAWRADLVPRIVAAVSAVPREAYSAEEAAAVATGAVTVFSFRGGASAPPGTRPLQAPPPQPQGMAPLRNARNIGSVRVPPADRGAPLERWCWDFAAADGSTPPPPPAAPPAATLAPSVAALFGAPPPPAAAAPPAAPLAPSAAAPLAYWPPRGRRRARAERGRALRHGAAEGAAAGAAVALVAAAAARGVLREAVRIFRYATVTPPTELERTRSRQRLDRTD